MAASPVGPPGDERGGQLFLAFECDEMTDLVEREGIIVFRPGAVWSAIGMPSERRWYPTARVAMVPAGESVRLFAMVTAS
jgi:hypothetical protein